MYLRGFTPGLYLDGMRLQAWPYSTPQIDFNRVDHIDVNGASIFTAFETEGFTLVDTLIGYDLGRAVPSLQGFELALNASNLLDKRHVSACPFNNSCYFGASRTVTGTLRYAW